MSLDFASSPSALAAPGIAVPPSASFSSRRAPASSGFESVLDSRREAARAPSPAPVAPALESDGGTAPAAVHDHVPPDERPDHEHEIRTDSEALLAASQPAAAPPPPAGPDGQDAHDGGAADSSGFEHIIPASAGDVREWIERSLTREASLSAHAGTEDADADSFQQLFKDVNATQSDAEALGETADTAEAKADVPMKGRSSERAQTPPAARLADAVAAYVNGQANAADRASADADAEADRNSHQAARGHEPVKLTGAAARADVMSQLVMNAASDPLAPVAAPAAPNEAQLAQSIVQTIRMQWHQGGGTAVLSLEPEYLGGVTVALQVDKGNVTATLHADDPKVRAWMAANEPLLRQGLAEQGLSLERLVISEEEIQAQADSRRRARQHQPEPQKPSTRRRETSTFAVTV